MRRIENIIIHNSDSEWGCMREIRAWHIARGWKEIGYHFVILNSQILPRFRLNCLNGMIECGRFLNEDDFLTDNEVGAHALGYNRNSVGICLVGKTEFTTAQFDSLKCLLRELMLRYSIQVDNILGHYETESGKAQGKTCPNFDVGNIRVSLP